MKRALICFIIFLSVPFSAISQNPSQQTIIIVNTSGGYGDDAEAHLIRNLLLFEKNFQQYEKSLDFNFVRCVCSGEQRAGHKV